jgi:hypothetical protein
MDAPSKGFTPNTILTLIESIFESLISHSDIVLQLRQEGRTGGGYLCIANGDSGIPLLIAKIGEPNPLKCEKYLVFCQEKVRRLFQHPDHHLSRSSRDPALDQWGGAVRGKHHLLSFSGLPEHLDEAFMFLLAGEFDELTNKQIYEIMSDKPANEFSKHIAQITGFRMRNGA